MMVHLKQTGDDRKPIEGEIRGGFCLLGASQQGQVDAKSACVQSCLRKEQDASRVALKASAWSRIARQASARFDLASIMSARTSASAMASFIRRSSPRHLRG